MGITLGSNFTVNTALPLDDRMVVADIAARNAIPSGRRFQGMVVHVLSDLKNYQLQGGILDGNFVDISAVTPPVVNVPFVGSSLVNIYNKTLSDLASHKTTAGIRPSGLNSGIGSPLLTAAWTQTDLGTNQLTITKAVGNAQGENIRFSIPVYQTNYGKVITVQFDFSVTANYIKPGSSTDGSLIMYLEYGDGVINTFQQLSVVQIEAPTESNNLTARYRGEFQYIVDATKSYWLMFYCPRTETTTWTAYVRNLEIRPAQYVYGTPITDWEAVTLSGSMTTNTTYSARRRRVGDTREYDVALTFTGAPNATGMTITLPETIDVNKLTTTGGNNDLGLCTATRPAVVNYQGRVFYNNTTSVGISIDNAAATYVAGNGASQAVPFAFQAGDYLHCRFSVPIQGLSSSVQMSGQTDTRVVAMRATTGVMTSIASGAVFPISTVSFDTHGSMNLAASGRYTIPVTGYYKITGMISFSSGIPAVSAYKNGSSIGVMFSVVSGAVASGSLIAFFNAGDIVDLRPDATTTTGVSNAFSVERISGPSAIAASETVSARYYVSSAASTTSSQPINYDTRDWDSHNAVTTGVGVWKFTAPISGTYKIENFNYFGATGASTLLFKNGTTTNIILGVSIASTTGVGGGAPIKLLAGEYIEIRPNATVTPTSQGTLSGANYVSILRIGNY